MSSFKQRSFRLIPDGIKRQLKGIAHQRVVVATVLRVRASNVKARFGRLGLDFDGTTVTGLGPVLPRKGTGRASRRNLEGEVITHRDLPKVEKVYSWESPNFGDWSKGSHTVYMHRFVFQTTVIPPACNTIQVELVNTEPSADPTFALKFRVNEVLDRSAPNFEQRLLRALNLLQENVGSVGVFDVDAQTAAYLAQIYDVVDWQILPPGTRDDVIRAVVAKMRSPTEHEVARITDRHDFLAKMQPIEWVVGEGKFTAYFGAKFSDERVVFENVQYGNACYVMRANWAKCLATI